MEIAYVAETGEFTSPLSVVLLRGNKKKLDQGNQRYNCFDSSREEMIGEGTKG